MRLNNIKKTFSWIHVVSWNVYMRTFHRWHSFLRMRSKIKFCSLCSAGTVARRRRWTHSASLSLSFASVILRNVSMFQSRCDMFTYLFYSISVLVRFASSPQLTTPHHTTPHQITSHHTTPRRGVQIEKGLQRFFLLYFNTFVQKM